MAEHVVIHNDWREEKAHRDREIKEFATDLGTETGTHEDIIKELKLQGADGIKATQANVATGEVRERLHVGERKHVAVCGRAGLRPAVHSEHLLKGWGGNRGH